MREVMADKIFAAFNFFASFAVMTVVVSLVFFRTLVKLITVHEYGAMSAEKVI